MMFPLLAKDFSALPLTVTSSAESKSESVSELPGVMLAMSATVRSYWCHNHYLVINKILPKISFIFINRFP